MAFKKMTHPDNEVEHELRVDVDQVENYRSAGWQTVEDKRAAADAAADDNSGGEIDADDPKGD